MSPLHLSALAHIPAPLRTFARDLWTGALDLVFAPVCVACDGPIDTRQKERLVCGPCWLKCRPLPAPKCPRCWAPVPPYRDPAPTCRACEEWPPSIRAVRAPFAMGDVPRALVHALKYGGWEAVGGAMAERMARVEWPRDVTDEVRWVVPVPTSRKRARRRGYNQAEVLARGVAAARGWALRPDLLVRTRTGRSQTALHPGERRANVARAFAVPPERAGELPGEHVLLVDDVWTTGATAQSCVEALREAGARCVSVATFARVVPELDR